MAEDTIFFQPAGSARTANVAAAKLAEQIAAAAPDANVGRVAAEGNMDLGAIVSVSLAAPSVVAVAVGVKNYLTKMRGAKVSITDKQGKVIAENLTSDNALSIIQSYLAKRGE
jgi:hypothetical protein